MKIFLFFACAAFAASGDFVRYSNQAAGAEDGRAKIALYTRALGAWTAADGKPNKGVVLANRAAARHQLGDYQGAVEDLEASMRVSGENALMRANRGAALSSLGRHAEAAADFTQAIRLEPRNPVHYASRAVAHDAMGKTDQAVLDYNVLLSLDPAFKDGRKTRGSLLFKAGRYAEAAADFDAAIAQNRGDKRAYQLKALAEEAIAVAEKNAAVLKQNEEMRRRAETAASSPAPRGRSETPFKAPKIDARIWLAAGGMLLLGIGIRALK